jgi:hypothetical protein
MEIAHAIRYPTQWRGAIPDTLRAKPGVKNTGKDEEDRAKPQLALPARLAQ